MGASTNARNANELGLSCMYHERPKLHSWKMWKCTYWLCEAAIKAERRRKAESWSSKRRFYLCSYSRSSVTCHTNRKVKCFTKHRYWTDSKMNINLYLKVIILFQLWNHSFLKKITKCVLQFKKMLVMQLWII